jgi:glycosyltransferase involved in cell wall biosynthesis
MEDRVIEAYGLPDGVRGRISVVPHGHYVDNYENTVSREDARERFGYDEGETVFLFFGQIRPYKGLLNLVEAFGSIDDPDSRLLIAGNPTDERLERELTDRIAGDDRIDSVLEFVPGEEIQFYMNAADVVVLPYTKIATSGSAILVMSFGRALVVPRLGCVPELLDDEGAVLYSPGAERGLRDALLETGDRDLRSMGEHNARLVCRYDWSDIAERTARIYARTRR